VARHLGPRAWRAASGCSLLRPAHVARRPDTDRARDDSPCVVGRRAWRGRLTPIAPVTTASGHHVAMTPRRTDAQAARDVVRASTRRDRSPRSIAALPIAALPVAALPVAALAVWSAYRLLIRPAGSSTQRCPTGSPTAESDANRLRVMADYFAEPVWGRHPHGPPVTLASLDLPGDLEERLRRWAARYDAREASDYGWTTAAEQDEFNEEGRDLARAVQRALGPSWDVVYEAG
jgi:hypothetical protein